MLETILGLREMEKVVGGKQLERNLKGNLCYDMPPPSPWSAGISRTTRSQDLHLEHLQGLVTSLTCEKTLALHIVWGGRDSEAELKNRLQDQGQGM